MRLLRGLAVALLLALLPAASALAGAAALPAGTYRVEFQVLDDDCGHDAFIDDLPDSITIEVGDNGALILGGPPPWVEIEATIDSSGSVTGSGAGTVAGFSGVSVLLDGALTEPGVLEGELSFGPGGELPGACPIVWKLTLISETPVGPATSESTTTTSPTTTTTSSTTTTTTTTEVEVESTTSRPPEDTTTTTFSFALGEDDGGLFPGLVILIGGLLLFAGGLVWWWWLYRTPLGYGPVMVRWLDELNKKASVDGEPEPDEADTETTTTTTTTTTTATTSTTDSDTRTAGDTTTISDDTTTSDGGPDDGQTLDGTDVFGSRTRPPPDCTPLVDECERLRAQANAATLAAKRAKERAERAQAKCDDAKAAAQRAQEHLDDLEPRTNATNYYTRMAWAQQELRWAQDRERSACGDVEQAQADAARAEADAEEAKARADEACARAQACLAGGG